MSKKGKSVIKFIIACGVVISAVAAVFAVIYRMRNKLNAINDSEHDDADDDIVCNGSCEGCTLCDEAEVEDETEDEGVTEDDAAEKTE